MFQALVLNSVKGMQLLQHYALVAISCARFYCYGYMTSMHCDNRTKMRSDLFSRIAAYPSLECGQMWIDVAVHVSSTCVN